MVEHSYNEDTQRNVKILTIIAQKDNVVHDDNNKAHNNGGDNSS